MNTTKSVAHTLGRAKSRIGEIARILKIKKVSRDYLFTDSEVERIKQYLENHSKPGPKSKKGEEK